MAKAKGRPAGRKLPSTATPPAAGNPQEDPALDASAEVSEQPQVKLAHQSGQGGRAPVADIEDDWGDWGDEPEYLIQGTFCLQGHEPGSELIEEKLGKVPSQKTTRIGVGLLIWLMLGLVFLTNLLWLALALLGLVLWQILSLVVQYRSGHRGHCMRTRAWRYAWGGLVPMPRVDPTREAE